MKVLLTTLNSKYIHTNLAIRYLKEFTKEIDTNILEFNINQSMDYILQEIYLGEYEIVGISTYIWNIKEVLELCEKLKIVRPSTKIILGGPEVSFESLELMKDNPSIDYIIRGEGEQTYSELINYLVNNEGDLKELDGITYRIGNEVILNKERKLLENLNLIPSPFYGELDYKNKIIYYETSRGCPFNCAFCLSSTIKGLRFFDINRVKRDLDYLISKGVSQVKFVDRTFNANKKYSMEIMEYIMNKNPENINFHFEVTAHLLDEEMLEFLKKPKDGLFQLEVGVQSTNEKTILAVGRDTDFNKLSYVVKKIRSYNNIHQHLDLIVGLPFEDLDSFKKSFNDVYSLDAEKIQVGFLKLLKGSRLKLDSNKYKIKYASIPPYEVLETNDLIYDEIIKLKNFEDIIEKYHNEEYFKNTINYLINITQKSPFDLYFDLSLYWVEKNYHIGLVSRDNLYKILYEYAKTVENIKEEDVIEILKFDYYSNNNQKFNKILPNIKSEIPQPLLHELLKDEEVLNALQIKDRDIPTKKIINRIKGVEFKYDIEEFILSNYENKGEKSIVLFNHLDEYKKIKRHKVFKEVI